MPSIWIIYPELEDAIFIMVFDYPPLALIPSFYNVVVNGQAEAESLG